MFGPVRFILVCWPTHKEFGKVMNDSIQAGLEIADGFCIESYTNWSLEHSDVPWEHFTVVLEFFR